MAFWTGNVKADSLGMMTSIRVCVPHNKDKEGRKIMYLLHGLGDDSSCWTRWTSVERYASERNYTIVMPEVQKSFYFDMKYGPKYFTYVAYELPHICEEMFGWRHKREQTFVAGLSMGGYGAMKCGLSRVDFFGGVASFSGALESHLHVDPSDFERMKWLPDMAAIVGADGEVGLEDNVYKLLETAAVRALKPRMFVTCGTEDYLIEENRLVRDFIEKQYVFDFKYMEWEGIHDWAFWDKSVRLAMDFFDGRL